MNVMRGTGGGGYDQWEYNYWERGLCDQRIMSSHTNTVHSDGAQGLAVGQTLHTLGGSTVALKEPRQFILAAHGSLVSFQLRRQAAAHLDLVPVLEWEQIEARCGLCLLQHVAEIDRRERASPSLAWRSSASCFRDEGRCRGIRPRVPRAGPGEGEQSWMERTSDRARGRPAGRPAE